MLVLKTQKLAHLATFVAASVASVALTSTSTADDGSDSSTTGGTATFDNRFYVGTDIGVSILSNVKIKDYTPTPGSFDFGISDVEADADAGVAWNIDFGFKFNDMFSIELESGYYSNSFGGFSSGEFTTDVGLSTLVVGGDGSFTQIPVFVNGAFDIPLLKSETPASAGGLSLKVGGGIGVVSVAADIDSIGAAELPGVFATVDGSSWEFGGQFKIGLSWQLTHSIELGMEYRLMAVSGANFGTATFSDPSLVGIADIETETVLTQAVQARISFEF